MTATRLSCSCEQPSECYQPLMHFRQFFSCALKCAPWRYYSKQFYHCKALKPTILAIKLLIFSVIYFEGCSLLLRSSSILQINVLFSERPLIRKSLLIPIASDRRLKWSTPKFRCPFPTHEAAALKFQLQPQAVPASSPFRDGCHGFCCQLALCHNSYSVVLSTATQRFGRRNWVLHSILPVVKMLSSFHAKIAHDGLNPTLFH